MDDRFLTPRASARLGGSSSEGEWATPRSGRDMSARSDTEYFGTPRDSARDSWAPQQGGAGWGYMPHPEAAYGAPRHPAEEKSVYAPPHPYPPPQQPYMSHYAAAAPDYAAAAPDYAAQNFAYKHDGYARSPHATYAAFDAPQQPHYFGAEAKGTGVSEAWVPAPEEQAVSEADIEDIFSYARHNRVDQVDRMLDMGVPVNVRDAFGNTILSVSCQNGHKRVAKVRLAREPHC